MNLNLNKILTTVALFLLLSITYSNIIVAQCTNWIWAKGAGGSADDLGYRIHPDANGNVYVTGHFKSDSLIFGTNILLNSGSGSSKTNDIFLVKYDVFGKVLWARTAIGQNNDEAHGVTTDTNGNVYVVGGFKSTSITFGSQTLANTDTNTFDLFVVKYDNNGNLVWVYGSARYGDDFAQAVVADASGNIYVLGTYHATPITFGTYTLENRNIYDMFLVKFDPAGNVLWARSSGGSGEELSQGITTDNTGNIYATGFFSSSNDTVDVSAPVILKTNGVYDAFLIKYNAVGNVLWAKSVGGIEQDRGWNVTSDIYGNIYMVGEFESPSLTLGTNTLTNNGTLTLDMFLVKYNSNGGVLWAKSMGGSDNDRGRGVSSDIYGDVYVTGEFSSSSIIMGTDTLLNSGNSDIFLIKYDESGNLLWAKNTGGADADEGWDAASDLDGYTYVTGKLNSSKVTFDSDTIINNGNGDLFIAKIGNVVLTDLTGVDLGCYNDSSGVIDLTVYGGTPPYTYSWSNGDITEDLINVLAGKYVVTVTDSVNCFAMDSTVLYEPSPMNITHTSTDASCFNISDGTIDLTVSGGFKPYSFNWSTGDTSEDITGVPVGINTVIVTDSNGCNFYDTTTISSPPSISISISFIDDTTNNCTGQATATATGGTPPYSYLWNDPASQITKKAIGLCAGTYNVTVTDSNGCQESDTVLIVDLSTIQLNLVVQDVTCYGDNDGAINLTVIGGRAPYTFNWSNGATTEDLTFISDGPYTVTVTDANNTTVTDSTVVGASSAININYTKIDESCASRFDGSIDITIIGGVLPFTYIWSSGDTTEDLSNKGAGSYVLRAIDSNNCSAVSDTITLSTKFTPNPGIYFKGKIAPSEITICENDSIVLYVDTTYLKYLWQNGDSTQSITVRKSGNYSVRVKDSFECEGTSQKVVSVNVISDPAHRLKLEDIYYFCPDSADLNLDAGFTTNAKYQWQPTGDTNQFINITAAGRYSVMVSVQSCIASDTFVVVELCFPIVFVPNSFTPNDDGINDSFYCVASSVDSMGMIIFNGWGQILFQDYAVDKILGVKGEDLFWDGRFEGDYVLPGTYFYIVNYINRITQAKTLVGRLNVIR